MIEVNKIYCEDCLLTMGRMPDDSVDLIVTSPPYEDVSGAGYSAKKKDVLFLKLYSEFLDKFFNEAERIIKPTGQIFFNIKSKTFNKTLRTPHWIEFLDSFQMLKLKSYIIWKYAGSFDSTNKRFHLDYEIIYHLAKTDDIYLNENCGIADPLSSIWYIPHYISDQDRLHPTQMPEALVDRILKTASRHGDLIYDPFSGSGTTIVIANRNRCNWIASEISQEHCDIIEKRVKREQSILKLNFAA